MISHAPAPRDPRPIEDGPRRKVWLVAGLILFVALAVGALIGDRGFFYLFEQQRRADALHREVDDLKAENARLGSEIASLRSDPRAIERIAREELGLARPGETVFILREDGTASRP
ncbi:MAG TPA: septum formation initiator family protein [Vicinamibacteria bacterium]|nr:septum formation initiator family protein [Vicinamibacteria bacterium]